jgi:hypothetical protein
MVDCKKSLNVTFCNFVFFLRGDFASITQRQKCTQGGRGESNFHIETFAKVMRGQKGEFGGQPPELALLTARNFVYCSSIQYTGEGHTKFSMYCRVEP